MQLSKLFHCNYDQFFVENNPFLVENRTNAKKTNYVVISAASSRPIEAYIVQVQFLASSIDTHRIAIADSADHLCFKTESGFY